MVKTLREQLNLLQEIEKLMREQLNLLREIEKTPAKIL
jgi:hypothetical protein